MSQIIIEDEGWKAIMADPDLARARSKLSFHEIRLIVNHARAARDISDATKRMAKILGAEFVPNASAIEAASETPKGDTQ